MHARHLVSVKVAIFSADLARVLLMYYPRRNIYGLPGGHIDRNEAPDDALARELMEELGVSIEGATRCDFFRGNRLILAYTAIAPVGFETYPTHPKKEYGVWHTRAEVTHMAEFSDTYRQFVLAHWPAA